MKNLVFDYFRWIMGMILVAFVSTQCVECARIDANKPRVVVQEDCREGR